MATALTLVTAVERRRFDNAAHTVTTLPSPCPADSTSRHTEAKKSPKCSQIINFSTRLRLQLLQQLPTCFQLLKTKFFVTSAHNRLMTCPKYSAFLAKKSTTIVPSPNIFQVCLCLQARMSQFQVSDSRQQRKIQVSRHTMKFIFNEHSIIYSMQLKFKVYCIVLIRLEPAL